MDQLHCPTSVVSRAATVEVSAKPREWVETLEGALCSGQNAAVLIELLPPFYGALGIPDRTARTQAPVQRGRKTR